MTKRGFGQYYTINNPFRHPLFSDWFGMLLPTDTIVEPFAGSNNIIKLVREATLCDNRWKCYDIEPSTNNVCPDCEITISDSLKNMNTYKGTAAITNPPYLAKNSATRRHLPYPSERYDDLYKECLDLMLSHFKYVAAIIPESFITSGLFRNRLYGVISLNYKMFNDTECPVCLALFDDNDGRDKRPTMVYVGDEFVGNLQDLEKYNKEMLKYHNNYNGWKFNDVNGVIGIHCIDNLISDNIYFRNGEDIDVSTIKVSNRSFSRVGGFPLTIECKEEFISRCNDTLNQYRKNTKDVFMTSFKGLRKDNKYRRRLDFKLAKCVMNKVLTFFNSNNLVCKE